MSAKKYQETIQEIESVVGKASLCTLLCTVILLVSTIIY